MESQNRTLETQYGDMGPEDIPEHKDSNPPSLSALLADRSVDHTGIPISVGYKELWITKASANPKGTCGVPQADVKEIRNVIAPAARNWELENGMIYHHDQSPIPHGHEGLEGAKIVPIKLNLDEGESMHSFAADKALRNNDFSARRLPTWLPPGMPEWFNPRDFERWRIYDSKDRLKKLYPAHYLVWKGISNALYARIPKPLKGLSRAASCDHCRIHDPEQAGDKVDYFDDRAHVGDKIREMSVLDTAITPFSLCRFHWWYVWSGELLRPSHIRALEMLLSQPLSDRWGISHMREFLSAMGKISSTPDKLDDYDDYDDDVDEDDQFRELEILLLNDTGAAVPKRAEESSSLNVPQSTVASTDEQQTVPGGQQAGTTTADGPNSTTDSDQEIRELQADVLRALISHERRRRRAEIANAGPGNRADPARRAVFGLPPRAYDRRGLFRTRIIEGFLEVFPGLAHAQETNGLASQHTNGDSQTIGDIHNTQSVPSSAPAPESHHIGAVGPAEPSGMNGQSTAPRTYASIARANSREQAAVESNGLGASNHIAVNSHQQGNDAPASQANGLVASNPVAPAPQTQTNGEPARREDGLLYEPPTEPRALRRKRLQ